MGLYLIPIFINGQNCNLDTHSNNINDSWVSCEKSMNPNTALGMSHWVQYDLGYVYTITSTKFWNYNVVEVTTQGMKTIQIDYSTDGINWSIATIFQLNEASGMATYTGEDGPDLGGIQARYILLTALDTWGDGNCAGLSEVRFDVDQVSLVDPDLLVSDSCIELLPNPTTGYFTIKGNLSNYTIQVLDAAGNVHQNLTGSGQELTVDISSLPNGLYFISVVHQSNTNLCFQKIIKQ